MITRVTQRMLTGRELSSVESASTRMASAQEQMTTGRKLNRPSDSPADTTVALKARAGIKEQAQYQRNAQDGIAWLSTVDTAVQTTYSRVQRAYTLAVQGANTATNGGDATADLSAEVDQIKQDLVSLANSQYLGRPVFGGTTASGKAFDTVAGTDGQGNPTSGIRYVGDGGTVQRRVGPDMVVRVDSDGQSVFGKNGDNVFDHLDALSSALKAGDAKAITASMGQLQADMKQIGSAEADEGARMNQINAAVSVSQDNTLALQKTQSDVEDVDIAQATINMQTQTTAYQAALMAVSKTTSKSLLDFLS